MAFQFNIYDSGDFCESLSINSSCFPPERSSWQLLGLAASLLHTRMYVHCLCMHLYIYTCLYMYIANIYVVYTDIYVYSYICYLPPHWIQKNPMVSCMPVSTRASFARSLPLLPWRYQKLPEGRWKPKKRRSCRNRTNLLQFEATTVPMQKNFLRSVFAFKAVYLCILFLFVHVQTDQTICLGMLFHTIQNTNP